MRESIHCSHINLNERRCSEEAALNLGDGVRSLCVTHYQEARRTSEEQGTTLRPRIAATPLYSSDLTGNADFQQQSRKFKMSDRFVAPREYSRHAVCT
jgi:hypothetical protein